MCDGCNQPVSESFDIKMDDHYHVDVVVCHACAARERKARQVSESDGPRLDGARYIVTPEED